MYWDKISKCLFYPKLQSCLQCFLSDRTSEDQMMKILLIVEISNNVLSPVTIWMTHLSSNLTTNCATYTTTLDRTMLSTYLAGQEQAWNCCPEQPCQVEAWSREEPALKQYHWYINFEAHFYHVHKPRSVKETAELFSC